MSQFNYEGREKINEDVNWQPEQPSITESIDNSRFINKLHDGLTPDIVSFYSLSY